MSNSARKRVFDILEGTSADDTPSQAFAFFMTALILLNVSSVVLETEEALFSRYKPLFLWFEVTSVAIFTVEYLLRLWTCTTDKRFQHPVLGRIRYAMTPLALVDLVAILPFYLPAALPDMRFVRVLRLFRLLRIFKLGRYSESVKTLGRVLRAKKEDLAVAVFAVLMLLVLASSIMYFTENEAQPHTFSSIPASMWWGVVTLTTVGYGDVYPITPLGKLFGSLIAFLGIGLFALPAGILASGFTEEMQRRHRQRRLCPHCGKDIDELPEELRSQGSEHPVVEEQA